MRLLFAIGLLASYSSTTVAFARRPAFATWTSAKTKLSSNDKHLVRPLFMSTVELKDMNSTKTEVTSVNVPEGKEEAFPGVIFVDGKITDVASKDSEHKEELKHTPMRPRSDPLTTSWEGIQDQLIKNFKMNPQDLEKYDNEMESKDALLEVYKAMQLARQFEVACNKQYMVS
jgi:hypothetical protein